MISKYNPWQAGNTELYNYVFLRGYFQNIRESLRLIRKLRIRRTANEKRYFDNALRIIPPCDDNAYEYRKKIDYEKYLVYDLRSVLLYA